MYWYFSILIILLLLILFIINFRRKKRIVGNISSMPMEEKYDKLNQLAEPFGYWYNRYQDVFSSTTCAWQKEFGYLAVYDIIAPRFNMVFDCEPIYFYYDDKTWLIELWKGQYGINAGGEIGIYNTDHIVARKDLRKTLFHAASGSDMLPLSINLIQKQDSLARISARHWWLTAFRMGHYIRPTKLILNISITFPDPEMLNSFVHAMFDIGYSQSDMGIFGLQIFFSFDKPYHRVHGPFMPLIRCISQLENRLFCWLYRVVTRPFCLTVDRLLYLYSYMPFAFRRMIRLRRYKKLKKGKRSD